VITLARKYISEYRQGNPFSDKKQMKEFNIAYSDELKKFFASKPQEFYNEYYKEVARRGKKEELLTYEKHEGQLFLGDMEPL